MHYGEAFKSRQWRWASHEPARIEQGLRTFAKLLPSHLCRTTTGASRLRFSRRSPKFRAHSYGIRSTRDSSIPSLAIAFCTRVLDDD